MVFLRHDVGELVYYTIPFFDETGLVKSCFSTRRGGVSDGNVKGLNLGITRPDDRDNVIENFRILCNAQGIDIQNLVLSHQVHGKNVKQVGRDDIGKGIIRPSDIKRVDGLVTNEKGVALTTFYADCVPLFFLDRKNGCIGLSHSGWRGTVARIGKETLDKMRRCFGTVPEDVLVAIGPSICKDCYEVDKPVINKLKDAFSFWRDLVISVGNDKYLLDLQLTNERLMIEAGVPEKNIINSGLCTRCNENIFYSYRREGKNAGSLAAILELI